jgi:hypothetical protein
VVDVSHVPTTNVNYSPGLQLECAAFLLYQSLQAEHYRTAVMSAVVVL